MTDLQVTRGSWRRRLRPVHIPPVLHRVWLGEDPMPPEFVAYGETFARHHPGWEQRLWTDADVPGLGVTDADRAAARSLSEVSNLLRYTILLRHGGVYVDTDVECRRSFDSLLRGVRAFAALEVPGRIGTAVLGAAPGHPVYEQALEGIRARLGTGISSPHATGPYYLSEVIEAVGGVTVFEAGVFYPYLWTEPERAGEAFPDAYAVHHWAASWMKA